MQTIMQDYKVVSFDPRTASREDWEKFHVYRRLRHSEFKPNDPLTGDETTEQNLKNLIEHPMIKKVSFSIAKL